MFKIKSIQKYLSIEGLLETDLPDFTVLIGKNGSGKTHLLKAIQNGSVITSLDQNYSIEPTSSMPRPPMPTNPTQFVYLDSFTTAKKIEPTASSITNQTPNNQIAQQNNPMLAMFDSWRANFLTPFINEIKDTLVRAGVAEITENIDAYSVRDIYQFLASYKIEVGSEYAIALTEIFQRANLALVTQMAPDSSRAIIEPQGMMFVSNIKHVSERLKKTPLEVTRKNLEENGSWGSYTLFAPEITQIFSKYRDADIRNKNLRDGYSANERAMALSHKEFLVQFGQPPWDKISEILQEVGFKYKISPPSANLQEPCSLRLTGTDTELEIQHEDLSNGEKQILSTILALFVPDELRVNLVMPQLLLLDELDAPLHPSAFREWLDLIKTRIVEKLGIKCILTTHSPVTVALAPDDSIFEISNVDGVTTLTEINKNVAINKLTSGLPNLSVDYESRRFIITESDTDEKILGNLMESLKGSLSLTRSLTFMSVSKRKENQEKNSGYSVVLSTVNKFVERGNDKIFGVIDWDKRNNPNGRIKVLGHGSHNSMENVILDPLLIAALLLRDDEACLGREFSYIGLKTLTKEGRQKLSTMVQKIVLDKDSDKNQETIVNYFDGSSINVSKEYLLMNGHELENVIVARFPALNAYFGKGRGKIGAVIAGEILRDFPNFCPAPFVEIFFEISEA